MRRNRITLRRSPGSSYDLDAGAATGVATPGRGLPRLPDRVDRLLGGEGLLGNRDRGHGFGPAGVEGQMSDRLDQLGLTYTIVSGVAEVEAQLVGIAAGDQGRDGDETAVAGGELASVPNVVEQDVVGELGELWGDVTDAATSCADLLTLLGLVRHGSTRVIVGQCCLVVSYCSSVTCSPHSVSGPSWPSARPSQIARWVMNCFGAAPCQCHSPGGHQAVSPGRITRTGPPRDWVRPTPSVT
jgi:hypothetical protein